MNANIGGFDAFRGPVEAAANPCYFSVIESLSGASSESEPLVSFIKLLERELEKEREEKRKKEENEELKRKRLEKRVSRESERVRDRWVKQTESLSWPEGAEANAFVTINLDFGRIEEEAEARSVCNHKLQLFDNLRRQYQHLGLSWQAAWVIEIDGKRAVFDIPHVHMICHLPEHRDLRRRIVKTMWKATGQPIPAPTDILHRASCSDSGTPVHIARISDTRRNSYTGRAGYFGLVDYMAKNLVATRLSTALPYSVGKVCGISRSRTTPKPI